MLRHLSLLVVVVCLVGCSGSRAASTTQSSEQAFQLGRDAFEAKNYDEAVRKLDDALLRKGLNADLAAEALMMRAKANIQLNRPKEALRDLAEVSLGPAPREEVLAAKGDVAILEGNLDEARRLYAKAKQLNPAVALPEKL